MAASRAAMTTEFYDLAGARPISFSCAFCPCGLRPRGAGLRVWAWGVSDQEKLRHAVAAGIGGCTLDFPDWADALL